MSINAWNDGWPENPRWCAECMFADAIENGEPRSCRLKKATMITPSFPQGIDASSEIKKKCAMRMISSTRHEGIKAVQESHRCKFFVADGLKCMDKPKIDSSSIPFGGTQCWGEGQAPRVPEKQCGFTCLTEHECHGFHDKLVAELPERKAMEKKEREKKTTTTLDKWIK